VIAAADDHNALPEPLAAATMGLAMDVTATAIAPAAAAALADQGDGGLRFRHTLVRSAIIRPRCPPSAVPRTRRWLR
jgi:hypothetical protein